MPPLKLENKTKGLCGDRFVSCVLLILLICTPAVAQRIESRPKTISAVGLVVDVQGRPVSGATVHFESESLEGNDMAPGFKTGPTGFFQLKDTSLARYAFLMVSGPLPDGFTRSAVSTFRLRQFPEFRGLRLRVPRNSNFVHELGYIKPNIVYEKVTLDLTELFADDFAGDYYHLKYSVRFKGKLISEEMYVDSRDFDFASKKLTWAFPKGQWKVSFTLKSGRKTRLKEFQLLSN